MDDPRHACHHEHKLQKWGWLAYDGHHYGLESIGDAKNGVVSYSGRERCWVGEERRQLTRATAADANSTAT